VKAHAGKIGIANSGLGIGSVSWFNFAVLRFGA